MFEVMGGGGVKIKIGWDEVTLECFLSLGEHSYFHCIGVGFVRILYSGVHGRSRDWEDMVSLLFVVYC